MPKNIREFTPEEKIQRAYDMIQIKNVMGPSCVSACLQPS